MIGNFTRYRYCIIIAIMVLCITMAKANTICSKPCLGVEIVYIDMIDSCKIISVNNRSGERRILRIDGNPFPIKIADKHTFENSDKIAKKEFSLDGYGIIWPKRNTTSRQSPQKDKTDELPKDEGVNSEKTQSPAEGKQHKQKPKTISYIDKLNQDSFFGQDAVNEYICRVNSLCDSISTSNDRRQFIAGHDITLFLEHSRQELCEKEATIPQIAKEIVTSAKIEASSQASTMALIVETLNNRLKSREDAYNRLNDVVACIDSDNPPTEKQDNESIINYAVIGSAILLVIVLIIVAIRKKRRKVKREAVCPASTTNATSSTEGDNPAIVVRRRTTSILKRQCIDDVINNPEYMVINTSDFTADSAVDNIYLKNSCIKEVYMLYADDLRNSNKPKEDGCMVLGRWVHHETTHTYDISLEEVVFPGDDAVFKEYELNFGGKIKLRIAEKLRKLRRETNLQYDLVCWIHSHPGLGVFFSNYDNNVQLQLKHSQHPNFLIAFVIDILTSNQETGIFTFRKDGTMNSKGDITKMYSLEEMYKWALESERQTLSLDNYYNILQNARLKMPSCKGVEMNNSSIIDLTQIVIEPTNGIVGWAVGTTVEKDGEQELIISSIAKDTEKPTSGIIGCLINVAHMSLPTIQRLVALESANLSFVMVYSSKQMSLTTIPVINGELLTDGQFYGDVNIDDLKIWTRRKR